MPNITIESLPLEEINDLNEIKKGENYFWIMQIPKTKEGKYAIFRDVQYVGRISEFENLNGEANRGLTISNLTLESGILSRIKEKFTIEKRKTERVESPNHFCIIEEDEIKKRRVYRII